MTSNPSQATTVQPPPPSPPPPMASSPPASYNPNQATSAPITSASPAKQEPEPFDEFDPRGSVSGGSFGSVSGTEIVVNVCN